MTTTTPTDPADLTDLFRRPPDRHLDVGAGAVAHRAVGSGPDVLFVHGWPVSGATFRLLLPHLVENVTCHVIDLPGAGHSRFDVSTPVSLDHHIRSLPRVLDLLGLEDVAVVGHDSGGLVVRHALAGDPRVRAMALIDSELPQMGWRFRLFVANRRVPAAVAGPALAWVTGARRVRRSSLAFGGAFADRSLLDGDFDELFLRPLRDDPAARAAAVRTLRGFDLRLVRDLPRVHERIDVPVHLVWGEQDVFFPVGEAERTAAQLPDGRLTVVPGAGLFSHEERPAEVARALLPTLVGAG